MDNDIKVLIIGTDINAYYMARCYHELTGKNADLIGKENMAFTSVSKITNIQIEPNLWDNDTFVKVLLDYAENNKDFKSFVNKSRKYKYLKEFIKYLKEQ